MRTILAITLVALAGCVAALPDLSAPPGDEVTVFVHDFAGGQLKGEEPPHDIAWLTVGQTLTGGSRSLARPFAGMRAIDGFPPLAASGPLTRLTTVPWLSEEDFYASWIDFGARELPGFTTFSYDWRRDVRESAARLGRIVDALAQKRGAGAIRVNFVAHGLGGLVVLHWLRHADQPFAMPPSWPKARLVKKVVFAGTPFLGGAANFAALVSGRPVGRNTALLSREAMFTFPSVFQQLPRDGRFFADAAGLPSAFDALELDSWLSNGWSVFDDPALRVEESYRRHLRLMLRSHADLHEALAASDGEPPPFEVLAIVGTGRSTPERLRVTVSGFDLASPITADGDGHVTSASATPPKPLDFKRFDTAAAHGALLTDAIVQQEIARFLKSH